MILNLYFNEDSKNTIGKTLVLKASESILLKAEVDEYQPVLVLRTRPNFDFSEVNYAEISELGRFYFIESIERISNKLIRVQFICDVLETYKLDILNSVAKYRRTPEVGDYGRFDLETKSKPTIISYSSSIELPEVKSLIISTVGEGNE